MLGLQLVDVVDIVVVVVVAVRDLPISCCSTARSSSERREATPPVATVAATAASGVGAATVGAAAAAACFSNIEAFCKTEARERSSASPVSCAGSVIFNSDVATPIAVEGGGGGVGELT